MPSTVIVPPLGLWNAAISPMMVDLPEPDGPTKRRHGAGLRVEVDAVQHLLAGLVGETDVFEIHFAAMGPMA